MSDKKLEEKSRYFELDKWVECTGFVAKNTSYYFELQSLIDDAWKAAQTDMLAESVKGFEDWIDGITQGGRFTVNRKDVLEKAWQACSQMKDAQYKAEIEAILKDYEFGKELSHEDMFRIVKHHQGAAQANLQESSRLKAEIEAKEKGLAAALEVIKTDDEYISALKAEIEAKDKEIERLNKYVIAGHEEIEEGMKQKISELEACVLDLMAFVTEIRSAHMRLNDGKPYTHDVYGWIFELAKASQHKHKDLIKSINANRG